MIDVFQGHGILPTWLKNVWLFQIVCVIIWSYTMQKHATQEFNFTNENSRGCLDIVEQ